MTLYDAIVGLKRSSEAKLEYALQFWPEAGEDRKRSGFCVDNLSGVSVGKPDPPQPKPRHQEASRAPGAEIGTNAPLRGTFFRPRRVRASLRAPESGTPDLPPVLPRADPPADPHFFLTSDPYTNADKSRKR